MERPERRASSTERVSAERPARVSAERPTRVRETVPMERPSRESSERPVRQPRENVAAERPARQPRESSTAERPVRAPRDDSPERPTRGERPTRASSSNTARRQVVVNEDLVVGSGERVRTKPTESVSVQESSRQKVLNSRSVKQSVSKPKESKQTKVKIKKRKTTSKVEKGDMFRLIVIPCVLMLCFSISMLVYHNIKNNSVTSQVEYIRSYMTGSGTINDWQGKLQCKGIEDIHWYRTNNMIEIDFGNIIMTWDYEQFITQSNLDLIKTIGFEVYYTKDHKDIRLFWSGKEVERWVK